MRVGLRQWHEGVDRVSRQAHVQFNPENCWLDETKKSQLDSQNLYFKKEYRFLRAWKQ